MQLKLCNYYLRALIVSSALLLTLNLTSCSSKSKEPEAQLPRSQSTLGQVDTVRSAKYNIQLALGYLEQGDVERAKEKLLKALKQAPELPEVHYNLAHFYYLIDERELADEHFNKAISMASNSTTGALGTSYNNYGVFLCQVSQYSKAYDQFKQAMDDTNYADTASAYENAGLCALKAEDKKLAANYFEGALKKNPLAPKSLIELSEYYYDTQNYDKSKFYLQRYNQLNSDDKRALMLNLKLALLDGNDAERKAISANLIGKFPEMKGEVTKLQSIGNKVRVSPKSRVKLGN